MGETASAPYSFIWNNVGSGSHTLMARAVYDSGSTVDSSPVSVTVSTSQPPPSSALTFAATSGAISAPFVAANGVVYQSVLSSVSTGGRAAYSFSIANPGNYVVSAQVSAPDDGANSFYVNIDGEPSSVQCKTRAPAGASE